MSIDSPVKSPAETVIWTDTQRAGRDGRIVDQLGPMVRAVGVGGPRTAEVDALARRLDCPHQDDLRHMLMDRPGALLLLGSMGGAETQDIASAVSQGARVLAIEPAAARLGQLPLLKARGEAADNADREGTAAGYITPTPPFERSAGWISAANPLEILGDPQLISFTSFGQLADCSLFARIMDAWRSVLALCDLPLSIDASLSGPLAQPPEEPRGLTGHVAAHGRLPNGGSVLLQASDRAGNHCRALNVISVQGRLGANDLQYHLYDTTGNLMDKTPQLAEPVSFVDLVADHCRQVLRDVGEPDPAAAARSAKLEAPALACCLACLLSARTGEPESPAKLMKLQGRG